MEDKVINELFGNLSTKRVVGIRKDGDFQISIKLNDGTVIKICGGSVDYGEIDILDIDFQYPNSTDFFTAGEF